MSKQKVQREKSLQKKKKQIIPVDSPHTQRILTPSMINLIIIIIICLAPFVDKAFHIDDPLFLWTAKHIQNHPLDFYGFSVNWYGTEMAMSDITKNPPLASYYIAIVASIIGWSEIALHLAFLIPAIGAILGTYLLARQFCLQPAAAALSGMLTPVFLVSSTNVMCDTMMLAFWVWAVYFWVQGLGKNKSHFLFLSALFISASALTKYYGVSLIPLLFLYSIFKRRSVGRWAFFLLIPVIILAGYQWATFVLYGKDLLIDAISYTSGVRQAESTGIFSKGLIGLAFTGGCLISVLFYSPLIWSKRVMAIGVFLIALSALTLPLIKTIGTFQLHDGNGVRWGIVIQFCLFAVAGVSLLALAALDLWKRRDAISLLLFMWIFGTFVFASFINWTVNGRSILPMAPAAGILLMRRISQQSESSQPGSHRAAYWPLIPAVLISLLVTWSDYTLANTARSAAFVIHNKYKSHDSTLWFQGHWGFQYYMESVGGKAFDLKYSELTRGDIVIIPLQGTNLYPLHPDYAKLHQQIQFYPCRWLTTISHSTGSGFYSHFYGPLPFAAGSVPFEEYYVFSVIKSIRYVPQKDIK
ncbi:MAG: hypothetical protein A2Y81_07885 [Nitrospirae bacterium RBG_13_43_8]|nr:MAG: hypothetical protein A2Y81_07885 [Nitrospirae bacterium RBG_13_43_8]